MPRLNFPAKPILVIKIILNKKKYYIIVSNNGYTYHHYDDFWRVYRLKDPLKYIYKSKREANNKKKYFNNFL